MPVTPDIRVPGWFSRDDGVGVVQLGDEQWTRLGVFVGDRVIVVIDQVLITGDVTARCLVTLPPSDYARPRFVEVRRVRRITLANGDRI